MSLTESHHSELSIAVARPVGYLVIEALPVLLVSSNRGLNVLGSKSVNGVKGEHIVNWFGEGIYVIAVWHFSVWFMAIATFFIK